MKKAKEMSPTMRQALRALQASGGTGFVKSGTAFGLRDRGLAVVAPKQWHPDIGTPKGQFPHYTVTLTEQGKQYKV